MNYKYTLRSYRQSVQGDPMASMMDQAQELTSTELVTG